MCGLGGRWCCSFRSTDATRMRFQELVPARKFSFWCRCRMECLAKSLRQDVLITYPLLLPLKVPGYPTNRNPLSPTSHPACLKELAVPSLLTPSSAHRPARCPRWCSPRSWQNTLFLMQWMQTESWQSRWQLPAQKEQKQGCLGMHFNSKRPVFPQVCILMNIMFQ